MYIKHPDVTEKIVDWDEKHQHKQYVYYTLHTWCYKFLYVGPKLSGRVLDLESTLSTGSTQEDR